MNNREPFVNNTLWPRLLVGLSLSALLLSCASTPVTGRRQLMLVPEGQVIEMSAQYYAEEMGKYQKSRKLDTDSAQTQRIRLIAARIIPQAIAFRRETQQWKWEVHLIQDKPVNAYCAAGGKIAVYTGLLDTLKPSDDELAQVIAHEVAHALASHSQEKMSNAYAGAIAVDVLAQSQAGAKVGQDSLNMVNALIWQLPNSRTAENEADRIGVELAARAGFDPQAAITLWDKMGRLGAGKPPAFLSTHPADNDRKGAMEALAPQMRPLYEKARLIRQPLYPLLKLE